MLEKLLTEHPNPASASIDRLPSEQALRIINAEDQKVAAAVEREIPAIARAVDAILRLHARWPGSEVVVVSHGDIVKAVVAYFLGTPIDLMRRIEIAPASRSVLWLGETDVSVGAINMSAGA